MTYGNFERAEKQDRFSTLVVVNALPQLQAIEKQHAEASWRRSKIDCLLAIDNGQRFINQPGARGIDRHCFTTSSGTQILKGREVENVFPVSIRETDLIIGRIPQSIEDVQQGEIPGLAGLLGSKSEENHCWIGVGCACRDRC